MASHVSASREDAPPAVRVLPTRQPSPMARTILGRGAPCLPRLLDFAVSLAQPLRPGSEPALCVPAHRSADTALLRRADQSAPAARLRRDEPGDGQIGRAHV